MKFSKSSLIIHGFALLHAATAIVCRLVGVDDSLVLTMMTMLMTVWLCLARGYNLEITAACVILVNVIGFFLGTGGARLIEVMTSMAVSHIVTSAVATFITTECLGWAIVLMTKLFRPTNTIESGMNSLRWFIVAVCVIIVFRLVYVEVFSMLYDTPEDCVDLILGVFLNAPALLLLIFASILYIRRMHRWNAAFTWKTVVFIAFLLVLSVIATLVVGYNLPFRINRDVTLRELLGMLMIVIILELTVYCLIYMLDYARRASIAMDQAQEREEEARFQYDKLKQQVNPHFLFNSLNSLDCLVCEGKDEQASTYIHKLSGIYRYMLTRGEDERVNLRDEMTFVDMYVDLMRLRFGAGFTVQTSIDDSMMGCSVVPCSVQLLVENALKHNVVSEEDPLVVSITATGDRLTVRNPLHPKLASQLGAGRGLAFINDIYKSLCNRPAIVERTETEYSVSIPLM